MATVMEALLTAPDMLLDLVNGVWTCELHGMVMPLDGVADCPECMESVNAPPHVPEWMVT